MSQAKFYHRGFMLIQNDGADRDYMLFDTDGIMRYRVPYSGDLLTRKEAKECIDFFVDKIEVTA